jgi:hypothetical protein
MNCWSYAYEISCESVLTNIRRHYMLHIVSKSVIRNVQSMRHFEIIFGKFDIDITYSYVKRSYIIITIIIHL